MILASTIQSVPIGDGTWQWIVGAAGVAVILNQIMQAITHFRPKPPYAEQFSKQADFEELRAEFKSAVKHNSERHSELFTRIEQVEEKWRGEMLVTTKEISQTLIELKTQFATLNERTTRTNEAIKDVSERMAVVETDVANLAGRQGIVTK